MYFFAWSTAISTSIFWILGMHEFAECNTNGDNEMRNDPFFFSSQMLQIHEEVYSLIRKRFASASDRSKCSTLVSYAFELLENDFQSMFCEKRSIMNEIEICENDFKIKEIKLGLRGYLQSILDVLIPYWLNDLPLSRKLKIEISIQMSLSFYGSHFNYVLRHKYQHWQLNETTFAQYFAELFDKSQSSFYTDGVPNIDESEWPMVAEALRLNEVQLHCLQINWNSDEDIKSVETQLKEIEMAEKERSYVIISNLSVNCTDTDVRNLLIRQLNINSYDFIYARTEINTNLLIVKCCVALQNRIQTVLNEKLSSLTGMKSTELDSKISS